MNNARLSDLKASMQQFLNVRFGTASRPSENNALLFNDRLPPSNLSRRWPCRTWLFREKDRSK
jgi:hypothetical protein